MNPRHTRFVHSEKHMHDVHNVHRFISPDQPRRRRAIEILRRIRRRNYPAAYARRRRPPAHGSFVDILGETDSATRAPKPLREQPDRSQLMAHGARLECEAVLATSFRNSVCNRGDLAHKGVTTVAFVRQR